MLKRILVSALFAGAATGLVAGVLQLMFVQPLLLHAEHYEQQTFVHFGRDVPDSAYQHVAGINVIRDGLSLVFSVLVYVGYALILVSLMSTKDDTVGINARSGIVWGIAGFVAMFIAPTFSLPPEVPGLSSGALAERQLWWILTVVSAGLAVWLIAFGRSMKAWAGAILLLLAPHLIGAPEPEAFKGQVPSELTAHFTARVVATGMAAWALLGCLAGYFWRRNA